MTYLNDLNDSLLKEFGKCEIAATHIPAFTGCESILMASKNGIKSATIR